jgi:hypothetical protein
MNEVEIDHLHEVNNHLLHKLVTLEIIVDSLYAELIESGVLNEEGFNKRVSSKIETVNKELKEVQKITETINSYTMFMNTKPGEA